MQFLWVRTYFIGVLRIVSLCNPYPWHRGWKLVSSQIEPRRLVQVGKSYYETSSYRLLRPLYYYNRPYPHKFQPTMATVCLCILLCGQRISSASPGLGKRPQSALSYMYEIGT